MGAAGAAADEVPPTSDQQPQTCTETMLTFTRCNMSWRWCQPRRVVCFGHVPSLECNNGCLCTLNDGSLLAVAHSHEKLDQLVTRLPHVVLQGTSTFLSANV